MVFTYSVHAMFWNNEFKKHRFFFSTRTSCSYNSRNLLPVRVVSVIPIERRWNSSLFRCISTVPKYVYLFTNLYNPDNLTFRKAKN